MIAPRSSCPGGECTPLRGAAHCKSTLYLKTGTRPSACPFWFLSSSAARFRRSRACGLIPPRLGQCPAEAQLQTAWVSFGKQRWVISRERRRPDFLVDASPPVSPPLWRCSSTLRKAHRKKSISAVCRPTSRSRSARRCRSASFSGSRTASTGAANLASPPVLAGFARGWLRHF